MRAVAHCDLLSGVSLQLGKYVERRDRQGFREALRETLRDGQASAESIETLKRIANPMLQNHDPFPGVPETLSVQTFIAGQESYLRREARIALVALGCGNDPHVVEWIITEANTYLARLGPGMYHLSPADLFLLLALNNEGTIPTLRRIVENAPLWSLRILCHYRLLEPMHNGVHTLIDGFGDWMVNAEPPNRLGDRSEWRAWRCVLRCLTIDGLRNYFAQEGDSFSFPQAYHDSPLVDWALDHGFEEWLTVELRWLYDKRSAEVRFLRNRLVEKGIPAAVELCCEQIRNARQEEYTHYDVVHNALRLHPRPLPRLALDACVDVIRRPSHPTRYEHRIEALHLLVDGADRNSYPKKDVQALILELVQTEADPDVRIAAIDLVRWASPPHLPEVLAGALAHETSRIREAAGRVLAETKTASCRDKAAI